MLLVENRSAVLFVIFLAVFVLCGCEKSRDVQDPVPGHDLEADAVAPLSIQKSHAATSRLRRDTSPTDILKRHIALVEMLTGQPLIAGNKVELLCDGPETFASMSEAIRNATGHINLETFILRDDEVGRPLADLLIRMRQEGVRVNILYDSFGAMRTPSSFFDPCRMGTETSSGACKGTCCPIVEVLALRENQFPEPPLEKSRDSWDSAGL